MKTVQKRATSVPASVPASAATPVATATVAVSKTAVTAAFKSVAPKATEADRAAEKAARKEVARKARATLKAINEDRPDARARELARLDGLPVPANATAVEVAVIRRSQPAVADRLAVAAAYKRGALTRATNTCDDVFGPVAGRAAGNGRRPSTRLFQPSAKGAAALARAFGASSERTISRREMISRACSETDARSASAAHRAADALALTAGIGRTNTVRCEIGRTLVSGVVRACLTRAAEWHAERADLAIGTLRASNRVGELTASALRARKGARERRAVRALARTFTKLYRRHGEATVLRCQGDARVFRAAVRVMGAPAAFKRATLAREACQSPGTAPYRAQGAGDARRLAGVKRAPVEPAVEPVEPAVEPVDRLAKAEARLRAVSMRGVDPAWKPAPSAKGRTFTAG